MSNNKQSSVEWLIDHIKNNISDNGVIYTNFLYDGTIQQAKAMHKQDMEFCFKGGMSLVEGRIWKPMDMFDEFYDKKFNTNENI